MKILIAGANGFIGRTLTRYLVEAGYSVTALTRSEAQLDGATHSLQWNGKVLETQQSFDVIINLCGENIAQKRWSNKRKRTLLASRIDPTQAIIDYIQKNNSPVKPRLINASAIGYYPSSDQAQTESHPAAFKEASFSRSLVDQWERCASQALAQGVVVTCLRLGVVLGPGGGMLGKLQPAFKLGLGAVMGDNDSYLSWIHSQDVCRAIDFIMQLAKPERVYNLTSPAPCSQVSFAKALADACSRSCFMRFPAFMVNALFGQMGRELLLANQRILPENLDAAGFAFNYSDIKSAVSSA